MRSRTFNPDGNPTLFVVFGFGNHLDGTTERWFCDQLTAAGYRVRAVELPTGVTSFREAYWRPVQEAYAACDPDAVIGHSLGGLVTAFLEPTEPTVYLAPWWGIPDAKSAAWERWLIPRLPIETPILPIRTQREELGVHVTDAGWAALPPRISPVFITEILRAQQSRPAIDDDAVVFVSLEETVVSLAAIGAAVAPAQCRLYEGGHELFSARGRDAAVEDLLTVLPGTAD